MASVATLNSEASTVMAKIIACIPTGPNSHNFVKIDNSGGGYMPLCVERGVLDIDDILELLPYKEKFSLALAHYGEQMGDLMRDPEVVFACYKTEKGWHYAPITFENSYLAVYERDVFVKDKGLRIKERSQRELCEFCDQWLMNIADQQEL